jgi:hypothetical protein
VRAYYQDEDVPTAVDVDHNLHRESFASSVGGAIMMLHVLHDYNARRNENVWRLVVSIGSKAVQPNRWEFDLAACLFPKGHLLFVEYSSHSVEFSSIDF